MSLLVKIGADLSSFERQMKKATREVQYIGKKLESVGKDLTTKVTLPLVGLGAVSVKVGMDFQSAMSEVSAISGATGDDLKMMEDAARHWGKNTTKSATEAADALKYMSLAGWDAKTSVDALGPVLRLSEAGALDLGRASDLVTDSMSSLGLSADQLEGYLDQVAQTSRSSNTNMDALMEAMIIAGGTFKNLNVPLDEANAMLGILANRGKKGSEAGNALNSIMVNLTSGAGQAGEALDKLGVSAFDSEGTFKGMEAVLREVDEATRDLTEEQRTQYLAMIGGKTQIDTLQALLGGLNEEYGDLRETVADSNGVLDEMSATMNDNLKGSLANLKSSLEEAGIIISEHLIPIVERVTEKFTKWVDWFSELDESTQKNIIMIGGIVAAIGPLLIIVGKTIIFFGRLKAAAAILAPVIGAISWPVVAVIAGIAALIAIGVLLYRNWDTVKEKASQFGSNIKGTFNEVRDSISNSINNARDRVKNAVDSIIGFFRGIGEKLKINIPRPKLPKFSLEGKFSLAPPSVPKLNISWHKNGGFFDKPTIAGLGEAGKEAIVPLVGNQMNPFADAVARRLGTSNQNGSNSRIEQLLQKLLDKNSNIVLDTGVLVGSTYDKHDQYGGNKTALSERWGR